MAKTTKPTKKSKSEQVVQSTKDIPYYEIIATCACGAEYKTGSTQEVIRVDICASCHPFFTGEKRFVDAEGRVEKFRKKYNLS